ncbi:MAG TPA: lipopolysaccharide biosynthesis protein [Polyangiaceae bacterium]|nr:lipopolysaccharide biosynthesis protein [Polyangiaceae bacterium]
MSQQDAARSAGRGGLALTGAKIYFIALGLVQQIALPRVLGLDGYGALSRVLSIASVAYNPITTMSIQAVSRSVVEAPAAELPGTVRRLLSWHALFGVAVAAAFALLTPTIATLAGASHVETPLRILSGVLLAYAIYTPLIGVANGQKRFVLQAGFDVTSATLRTVGLVAGAVVAQRALAAHGPTGSAVGFVASAVLVLVVSAIAIGTGRSGASSLDLPSYLLLAIPIWFGQMLLNLLFQADLTLLGRFASEAAEATSAPLSRADALVGAYRATQLFSFLPYQILIAITFILFPMLAGAAQAKDADAIARYVRTGMRLALIIAGAMVSVTLGLAPRLLALLFGTEAAALGGRALGLLSLGFGAFAIFGILTTVLNSLHRQWYSLLVTGFAVLVVATLCFWRARGAALSEDLLWLTAQATATGLLVATAIAGFLVYEAAGALVSPWTALRTLLALGVAALSARFLVPPGKLLTLVGAAVTPAIYLAVLLLTRELGRADLEMIRRVVKR